MSDVVISTIITSLCALAGTFGGIMATSKVTIYRIEQLEKKVDKHNTVIERTYKLEEQTAIQEEKIKVANHRIDDLEKIKA